MDFLLHPVMKQRRIDEHQRILGLLPKINYTTSLLKFIVLPVASTYCVKEIKRHCYNVRLCFMCIEKFAAFTQ